MRSVLRGALLFCALSTALPAAADVFVNEIHYDDADTPTTGDTNEAIEIVATGGEDLSLYSIVLYNGSSPAAAVVYDTDAVPAGSIVSCAGGGSARIAVINYPLNGVQNGTNDAIALVQGSTVVQFLSYEGVATASGGVAAGLTSVDIGVSEVGSTVEGTSLQLGGGPGSTYGGFSWNGSATATMGACNNGQSFGAPVDNPPQLTGSTPANGASGVSVTTEIFLQFSEAVTLNPAGITLTCGASPQMFTSSGSGNAYTITPDAALPYGSSCVLNIGAAAVQDVDGTPNPMASAATVSFSTVADNAPTLSTSTPAHNSTTFPANANLQLTFSEPVAVGSTWFNIVCATSGTRTVADTVVSGGPTSFTINPNVDFVQGESCTLNLVAAQITDLDGNLDAYVGTTAIAFTPAAPIANQLPVVLSTTPINGDANFPPAGDLVVLFSEPVTLAPGAFALTCTASTGIALVHASSGTSFTIDTGTVLASGDTCTFSIDRTKVTDGDGANPAAGTTVNFTVSNGSAGAYYAQVNTTGGPEQLRCSLHEIIDGHTVYPYSAGTTDTWDILELADQAPGLGNENMVLDAYKNELYPRAGGGNTNYNREHTWPNSLGFGNAALAAYTDTHMLYLTHIGYNSDRGNSPYVNCSGCTERTTTANFGFGGGSGVYPGNSNWFDANGFQVWNHRRGDMARAVMYMAIRYEGKADDEANDGDIPDLELTDNLGLVTITSNTAAKAYMGHMTTLLAWHQADPPDQREIDRNAVVQGFQGNRNPFIDHPEWATLALFTSSQPATCTMGGGGNGAPTADNDSYNATEDAQLVVTTANGVLVGDSDPESAPLTAVLLANVQHGALALAGDGSFTYMPTANYCGSDSFTYRASDGSNFSAGATVSLSITCLNDAPNAVGTLANQSWPVGTNVSLATAAGFADVDNDTLTYSATGLPASLSINPASGAITGTLLPGEVGVHNVVVTASDPSNATATQSFSITVTALADNVFGDGFE
jgi:endonuclease I/methionine-rich copper-binding protein CopC